MKKEVKLIGMTSNADLADLLDEIDESIGGGTKSNGRKEIIRSLLRSY